MKIILFRKRMLQSARESSGFGHAVHMFPQDHPLAAGTVQAAPFLPLAFRLGAAFGLLVLHLALPPEASGGLPGEGVYLASLALLFAESVWEVHRSCGRGLTPFATPPAGWIRFNLALDAALITLIIAFRGVDQAQLATVYIFPVLASAFYLNILEIVAVAILSSAMHITSVLLFTSGALPSFGRSSSSLMPDPPQLAFILGFATLQIFAAALVVVIIRKHLESLRQDLSHSESVVGELSTLYQQVFESMFSGLVTVDPQGRITSANQAAHNILLRPLEPGTPMEAQGLGALADLGSQLKDGRFELDITTPGGDQRIVGGNLVPLRGAGGLDSGHLVVFQDLTQLKALEERTRTSERLAGVGELSAEMAHELRNPMASILGCVQILKQGEQPKAMVDRVLTILGRESQRVSALVTDFLDFTRPRPARIQPIRLRAIIEELHASWETDPRSAGLAIQAQPPPDLWVLGDTIWVHQVFTNLLSNARKALKDAANPVIRLDYRVRPSTVAVTVSDTGCGMSEARRRAIFIPFSSGFQEGTGLGMSLVFQFVQQMGWDIQVDSELGNGTRVTLTLPIHSGTFPEPALSQDDYI
jgi:two-component system sensor histidine kinase PilS (NtrC family)